MNNTYNNKIVGYDSQTGAPIYETNNTINAEYQQVNNTFTTPIDNTNNLKEQTNYSSLSKRFLAFLLDGLFVCIIDAVIFMIVTILTLLFSMITGSSSHGISMLIGMLGIFVIPFIYYPLQEASKYHATLGKRIVNIIVMNEDGSYLTKGQAFSRTLIKHLLSELLIVSVVIMLASEKKQSLHDLILKQIVVNK